MDVKVYVENRILKPVNEVFAAIIDPAKMAYYFISSASSAMKAGTTVTWEFADVGAKVSVDVIEIEENRKIVFVWSPSGAKTRVTIGLKPGDPGTTDLSVGEAGWPMDSEGVKRALGQNAGWTFTLCCLKAYLQHGINLRLGTVKRLNDQR
jgi:uncharacterized protein YndB with AHSA1/START domain